jgi:hypothetical protein
MREQSSPSVRRMVRWTQPLAPVQTFSRVCPASTAMRRMKNWIGPDLSRNLGPGKEATGVFERVCRLFGRTEICSAGRGMRTLTGLPRRMLSTVLLPFRNVAMSKKAHGSGRW